MTNVTAHIKLDLFALADIWPYMEQANERGLAMHPAIQPDHRDRFDSAEVSDLIAAAQNALLPLEHQPDYGGNYSAHKVWRDHNTEIAGMITQSFVCGINGEKITRPAANA